MVQMYQAQVDQAHTISYRLASDSEDEKKIRKAKAAAEKKRIEARSDISNTSRKFKSSSDLQLFRGKDHYLFLLCEVLGPFGWTA